MSIVLSLLLQAHAAPAVGATGYLLGDVVNLRPRASLTGEPVARLRIGTAVTVLEEDRKAARVRVEGRPDAARLEGWVALELVGAAAPTLASIETALAGPLDAEQERSLSSRRRALTGAPDAELWIGLCRRDRTDLVGHLTDDGLQYPVGEVWSAERDPELVRLARALSAAPWFAGVEVVPGTPFATPFPRSNWNDSGSTAWAAAECEEICGQQMLVLGPCVGPLVATRPFVPTDALEVPVRETRRAVVVASHYDEGFSEVHADVSFTRPDGAVIFDSADGTGLHVRGETSWYAVPLDGGTAWLAHLPTGASLDTEYETLVLIRPDGRVQVLHAAVDGAGC